MFCSKPFGVSLHCLKPSLSLHSPSSAVWLHRVGDVYITDVQLLTMPPASCMLLQVCCWTTVRQEPVTAKCGLPAMQNPTCFNFLALQLADLMRHGSCGATSGGIWYRFTSTPPRSSDNSPPGCWRQSNSSQNHCLLGSRSLAQGSRIFCASSPIQVPSLQVAAP